MATKPALPWNLNFGPSLTPPLRKAARVLPPSSARETMNVWKVDLGGIWPVIYAFGAWGMSKVQTEKPARELMNQLEIETQS